MTRKEKPGDLSDLNLLNTCSQEPSIQVDWQARGTSRLAFLGSEMNAKKSSCYHRQSVTSDRGLSCRSATEGQGLGFESRTISILQDGRTTTANRGPRHPARKCPWLGPHAYEPDAQVSGDSRKAHGCSQMRVRYLSLLASVAN